ncbi:MAG: molybdopterin-dependent oxidoreductase, partial [Chloroflexi bacterium]|nr:molybdopterin-dependent oxidoreductase [Chloroflexota bacterium]
QALDEIAGGMLDVMVTDGPRAVCNLTGSQGLGSVEAAGMSVVGVWGNYMGIPLQNIMPEDGDEHEGVWEVFGSVMFGSSADNWYYSDIILIWGGNPSYSHTSVYHYITEARYNGTKVIAITADYSPSSICADEWVSVRIGSDTALCLGMCQVMLAEGLYNRQFVAEQTDLPLLVRSDNNKYLRESDVKRDGRSYVYYVFDRKQGKVVEAPSRSLSLDGLDPALEGDYEVQTLAGRVKVRPVMTAFKEKLDSEYQPEQASAMCDVHSDVIRRLAREIAAAKGVVNIPQYNFGKFYHGNLMERAMAYVFLLCGHLGRKGASFNAVNGTLTAEYGLGAMQQRMKDTLLGAVNHPRYPEWRERGFSDRRIVREMMLEEATPSVATFYYFHAGLIELSKKNNSWDPHLKRPLEEYIVEGMESRIRPLSPALGKRPQVLFAWGGDPLRRVRANQHLVDELIPKAKLFFTVDWRWNATAAYSDYVLPATGWYEKTFKRFSMHTVPIISLSFKAVEPLYESRSDWWIGMMLTRRIAEKARQRGMTVIKDPETGKEYQIAQADVVATANELYTEDDQEQAVRDAFLGSTNLEKLSWEEVQERGWVHLTSTGYLPASADVATDLEVGEPLVPLTYHVQNKEPYKTATGRAQFYIDHDWFIELDEEFAWHKDSPKAGGDYPLQVTGGHARWSIHSSWADSPLMLQLQRGEPIMFMSLKDARDRSIDDGDMVEVYNDIGRFHIMACVAPPVRPGQVMIYHSWNNNQFRGWRQFQHVMPTPFNPVEYAPARYRDYPNVASGGIAGDPGFSDRDSRVEVRKA